MNIMMTVMVDVHPVQVVVKQLTDGSFQAKTLGENPVEAHASTFNDAIDKITRRAAYRVDAA